jgi:hypothetical protein
MKSKYVPKEKEEGKWFQTPWGEVWVTEPESYHFHNQPLLKTTMFSNGFEISTTGNCLTNNDILLDMKDPRTKNGYRLPKDISVEGFELWHNIKKCSKKFCGRTV